MITSSVRGPYGTRKRLAEIPLTALGAVGCPGEPSSIGGRRRYHPVGRMAQRGVSALLPGHIAGTRAGEDRSGIGCHGCPAVGDS